MNNYHFIEYFGMDFVRELLKKVHMIIRGQSRSGRTGQIWRPGNSGQSYVSRGFFSVFCNYAYSLLNKSLRKAASFLSFRRPAKPQSVYVSWAWFLMIIMIIKTGPTRHCFLSIGKLNIGRRFQRLRKALPVLCFP